MYMYDFSCWNVSWFVHVQISICMDESEKILIFVGKDTVT